MAEALPTACRSDADNEVDDVPLMQVGSSEFVQSLVGLVPVGSLDNDTIDDVISTVDDDLFELLYLPWMLPERCEFIEV